MVNEEQTKLSTEPGISFSNKIGYDGLTNTVITDHVKYVAPEVCAMISGKAKEGGPHELEAKKRNEQTGRRGATIRRAYEGILYQAPSKATTHHK